MDRSFSHHGSQITEKFHLWVRYLALAAAIMVFLVIVLGGIVRVTGSGSL